MVRSVRSMRLLIASLCLTLANATWAQHAPDAATLEAAFNAVRNYEQGDSRKPLAVIRDAVTASMAADPARDAMRTRLVRLAMNADGSLEGRLFACRQLERVASFDDASAIAPLLSETSLRHPVLRVIATVDDDRIETQLLPRAAAAMTPGDVAELLNVVGQRGRHAGLEFAMRNAGAVEPSVRRAALAAIAEIDDPAAGAFLDQQMAIEPLARWTDRALRAGDGDPATLGAYAARLANNAESVAARYVGMYGLLATRPGTVHDLVHAALSSTEATGHGLARRALSEAASMEQATILAGQIATGDLAGEAAMVVIDALATNGQNDFGRPIAGLLDHDDAAVRDAALQALAVVGDERVVPSLVTRAAGGDDAAGRTLARMRSTSAEQALGVVLRDGGRGDRLIVCAVLGDRRAEGQAGTLISVARTDQDDGVRLAAFEALRRIAPASEIDRLAALLLEAPGEHLPHVMDVVRAIYRRPAGAPTEAAALIRAVGQTSDARRPELISLLADAATSDALMVARILCLHGSVAEARPAVETLCRWPTGEAAESLMAVAGQRQEEELKRLAYEGVAATINLPGGSRPSSKVSLIRRALPKMPTDEHRRTLFTALGTVDHKSALPLAMKHIDDASVGRAAAMAVCSIASRMTADPDAALDAVMAILERWSDDSEIRAMAGTAVNTLQANEDFITDWVFAGPYAREDLGGGDMLGTAFAPETDGFDRTEWAELPDESIKAPGYVDLLVAHPGKTDCTGYLRTTITTPTAQRARLEIGSDDGVRVWLNGVVVHDNNAMRGMTIGNDVVEVDLKPGANDLVLKISQGGGDWRACCRVRDSAGFSLGGMRVGD